MGALRHEPGEHIDAGDPPEKAAAGESPPGEDAAAAGVAAPPPDPAPLGLRPQVLASLPEVAVAVLASLYQHRLMTTAQVHALHTPGTWVTWTRRVLTRLADAGLADRVAQADTSRRYVWFATDRGAEAVEAAGQVLARPGYRVRPDTAAGPLQAHTLGCNDIGLAFARAARALGDHCGPASWHHEWAARIADRTGGAGRWSNLLTSDLLLRYLHRSPAGELAAVRLVEYDRNYRDLDDVLAHLRAYARYHDYVPAGARQPAWRAEHGPTFPRVLLVLDRGSPAALAARRESLTWMCREDPLLARRARPLGLLVTTLADLVAHGPWAPVFWPLADPGDGPPGPVTWVGDPAPPPAPTRPGIVGSAS